MDHSTRLVYVAPALAKHTWLPTDSGIDWLDSLGADHRRLLAARAAVGAERSELPRLFEREDEARREALTLGFRTGRDADLPPRRTSDERAAALAAVDEQLDAAQSALDSFLAEAVAAIEDRAPEWLAGLGSRRTAAAEKRREAQRLVAEADALETTTWRLRHWIERNAGTHERRLFRTEPSFRYVGWDLVQTLAAPPPPLDGLTPTVTDTHDPETFLAGVNRGIVPPHADGRGS